jgi:hypothetical protein
MNGSTIVTMDSEGENSEPESAEVVAIDGFFAAVRVGKGEEAAAALRKLPNLAGFTLGFLADILDPAAAYGKEPWRIRLTQITKGKPKKPKSKSKADPKGPFLYCLSVGDAKKAAKALRLRKKLTGLELAVLANLFDKSVALHKPFFFRFRLLSNQIGRPIDSLSEGASDASWRRIFANAFKKKPKSQTEAIQDVIVTLEAAKKKWASGEAVCFVVRQRVRCAGIDPSDYSGHSLSVCPKSS